MSTQQDNEKIIWVRGNTQQLLIPLEKEVVSPSGDITTVDFYPDEEAVIKVILYNDYRKYEYTPSRDGNLLTITDSGTLAVGCYGVAVTVKNPDGTRLHSNWNHQVVVTATNNSVLKEWDEFKQQDVKARAAIFFFAKGDKGDPFTYEDFTPEQIAALQKPAQDKADEVAELQEQWTEAEQERASAETQRASAEQARNTAENQRIAAEQGRVSAESQRASDTQAAINRANAATSAANTAAQNAKADYVGSDNYVYHWNATTQEYEKTNTYVKGDPGTTDYNELENKPDLTLKADKVIGGVNGHLAGLDANGNIMDSGKQPSDFATASQGAKADTALDQLAIIAALIPEQASSANQLADKVFVNSSIQTNTAEFKGTRNLVTDLSLTTSATQQQIASALASAISSADNNDYCFVQIPTDDATPTQIARVDRYKYNGSAWLFEWSLNNSSFTAAQWASINSTITSGDVDKLRLLPTKAQLDTLFAAKQNTLISGTNIKTINSNSILGNGDLDVHDVFFGTYPTTSIDDIDRAYNSNQIVILKDSVMRGTGSFVLSYVDYELSPMGAFVFVSLIRNQIYWFTLDSINGYSNVSVIPVGTYTKPQGGIPKVDLAQTVQASLGLADTSVQPEDIADTPDFVEEGVTEEMVDEFATLRTNLYQALNDAQQVTSDASDAAALAVQKAGVANDAATLANQKAELANNAATLADTKAGYANNQGDYAKNQGDYAKQQGDYAKAQGLIIESLDLAEFVEDNTDSNPFV